MATRPVPPGKLRDLITLHYFFQPSLRQLGGLLHLASSTVGEYLRAFNRSSLSIADVQTLGDAVLRERLVPPHPKPLTAVRRGTSERRRGHGLDCINT